jgi:hypothetical protein
MGYHPHGIISVGAFGAFATDGAKTISLVPPTTTKVENDESNNELVQDDLLDPRGFSSLFPGIDRRLITLPQNFRTPFLREYFLNMGSCDSAKETFRQVLSRNDGVGNAVVVVVGGAAESMLVQPGSIDLVLDRRRGFVREAILANACLVNTSIRAIIHFSRISLAFAYSNMIPCLFLSCLFLRFRYLYRSPSWRLEKQTCIKSLIRKKRTGWQGYKNLSKCLLDLPCRSSKEEVFYSRILA